MAKQNLFFRSVDDAERTKLMNATDKVIDLLRTNLKLERWECLLVVKTLYECFPLEDLFQQKGDKVNG